MGSIASRTSCARHTLLGTPVLWISSILLLSAAAAPEVARAASFVSSPAPLQLERVDVLPAGGIEEQLVLLELPLRPGDPLDLLALDAARERLEVSGFFDAVQLYTALGTRPGRVVVVVETVLRNRARFETGFGHEPLGSWYLNVAGLRWNNPFGRAGSTRIGLRVGLRTGGFYADYDGLALLGRGRDFLLRGRSGNEQWIAFDGDTEYRQELSRVRADAGVRFRAGPSSAITLWAGVERVEPSAFLDSQDDGPRRPASDLLAANPARQTLLTTRLELANDRRDAPAFPRAGTWGAARLLGGLVDGDDAFARADLDLRVFAPLPGRAVTGLRAKGSITTAHAPHYERVVVGGAGSARGFRDASLSGPRGSRAALFGSFELRRPLAGRGDAVPRLTGVLFADAGLSWNEALAGPERFAGAGWGIRVRVPWIQVFALDVGVPLTDATTRDPFVIHGSLGFGF